MKKRRERKAHLKAELAKIDNLAQIITLDLGDRAQCGLIEGMVAPTGFARDYTLVAKGLIKVA